MATLFLLSHSVLRRISQTSRELTYTYLCSVLKWEKNLSIFQCWFLVYYVSINFAHCLFHVHGCQLSVPWSAHTTYSCCPPQSSAVAVCCCNHYQRCHCHQPITAIVRIAISFFGCSCDLVEIFKSKFLSPRHNPEPPFCPDSKLTFALGVFVLGFTSWEMFEFWFQYRSVAMGKSTIWGWAKVVWQNCYLLSPSGILSL